MKRFVVFLMFAAAVLLSGCSSTAHQTITIAPASPQAGASFVITGMGFSSGSSCAQLTYTVAVGTPGNQSGTPVPMNPQPTCDGSGGFTLTWTPPQVSGCTVANNTVLVNAKDLTTGTFAAAPATAVILCEAALCPASLAVKLNGTPPNQSLALMSTSMPQYFASGCINCGNTSKTDYPPTGLNNALNFSTCTQCIPSFQLSSTPTQVGTGYVNGVSQTGGFEQCTYQMATPPSCPATWTNMASIASCTQATMPVGTLFQDALTLTFTCPDSGGCVGN